MDKSFYQFIQRYVDPYKIDNQTVFANLIVEDTDFPKYSKDYKEIAHYIEMTDIYNQYISIFDEIFEVYKEIYLNEEV